MLTAFFVLLVVLMTTVVVWSRKKFNLFRKHGVAEEPGMFPFGSKPMWKMMSGTPFTDLFDETYKQFQGKHKMVGTYAMGKPNLLIMDLELVKTVLVKDFDHMTDRRMFKMNDDYFDNILMMLKGDKWKGVRTMVTPMFAVGKLKAMFPVISQIGDNFVNHLEQYADGNLEFETEQMMAKFSLEVNASLGFGVDAMAFSDPNSACLDNITRLMSTGKYKRTTMEAMKIFVLWYLTPYLAKFFKFNYFDEKKSLYFFVNIIKRQMEERRKNPAQRNDFIDMLTQAVEAEKQSGKSKFQNKDELELAIVSSAFGLFFAGFAMTSMASSLCCYFLAVNPECQDKLHKEISEAIEENNGDQNLDYNAIQKLPYLEQCLLESIRAYPLHTLERTVTKPYKVPGTELVMPVGSMVTVASVAMHKDPKYFETPDQFNPDHFSEKAVKKRGPYPDGSFGHGPRHCFGKRFGLLQLKVAISRLVANYELIPCEKTVKKLEKDITSSNLMPKNGMWIKIRRR